jgi:hypothetical protein
MAALQFIAGYQLFINDLTGSGLGFYGLGGFGTSVAVGQYQDNTYITDSTGTLQGPKTNNVKWIDNASGQLPGAVNYALQSIPNYLSTLNVRFTNATPVKTQNGQLRIYDRVVIDNPPSGVTAKVAVNVHPWLTPTPIGSGSTTWITAAGSGTVVDLTTFPTTISPGMSGLCPSGANTTDVQHDWYFNLSAFPVTIGAKTQFALFFSCEFL